MLELNPYRAYVPFGYPGQFGIGHLGADAIQIASVAAQGAATTGALLTALHFSALAGPIGAAIAGLTAAGIALASLFKGCGQSCVQATEIANQAGAILDENLNHYINSPVRYRSMQLAALNNFDFTWAALTKACSNPALMAAGQRCISDRQRGACVWHSTNEPKWIQQNGEWVVQPAGPGTSNGPCWNWFVNYRDLIANDPAVQPDPVPETNWLGEPVSQSGELAGGMSMWPLLLAAAAAVAFVVVTGD